MTRRVWFRTAVSGVFTVGLVVGAACGGTPSPEDEARATTVPPHSSALAIIDVTVIRMDGNPPLRGATVVIRDGRIAELGPDADVAPPPRARRIDGNGRFLIPGLVDAHVHLRSNRELLSYLRHGVTTIWNLSGTTSDAPDILETRRAIAEGTLLGPTIYTTGPVLDGDPPIFGAVSTVVTDPSRADSVVARQHRRGFDFLKIYNNLSPAVAEAAIAAAHSRGVPVFGHIPRRPDRATALPRVLGVGLDVIAHAEEVFFTHAYPGVEEMLDAGEIPYRDTAKIPEVVSIIREADAAVIPNLSFVAVTRRQLDDAEAMRENSAKLLEHPEARHLSPATREMWTRSNVTRRSNLERFDRRERAKFPYVRRLTRELAAAGVPLFAGTDATLPGLFPGASLHLDLRELVTAGLTPHEALRAATRAPGTFVSRHVPGAPRTGVIEPGARADLVLLAADPLADIGNTERITGVVVRGRWLSAQELDERRNRRAQ